MTRPPSLVPRLALLAAITSALGGCADTPPENPDPGTIHWRTYTNEAAGYSVDLPDAFHLQGERGESALFRYRGYPVLCINLVDEAEGKARGLWMGHPASGKAELGGREGLRYVYHHYDGPVFMRTVSTVVPYRDKFLGLEFRTDLAEPDSVQRRILDSFRFR